MVAPAALSELFWSEPPLDAENPTDPLGLDAMREELADKLVPSLTGRTRRYEDFYWALVFIGWAADGRTGDERVRGFLEWERLLKLCWIRRKPEAGFLGVRRAKLQAEAKYPSNIFEPILKNQRTTGMLGAHLAPLRKIGLVSLTSLELTDHGRSLVRPAGDPFVPKADWAQWQRGITRAREGFGPAFRTTLCDYLRESNDSMRDLASAMQRSGWPKSRLGWGAVAGKMSSNRRALAGLAESFCPWADRARNLFEDALRLEPGVAFRPFGKLRRSVPSTLAGWDPLREELRQWSTTDPVRSLTRLHARVFDDRGLASLIWMTYDAQSKRRTILQSRAAMGAVRTEGSDCRWWNAVHLLQAKDVP